MDWGFFYFDELVTYYAFSCSASLWNLTGWSCDDATPDVLLLTCYLLSCNAFVKLYFHKKGAVLSLCIADVIEVWCNTYIYHFHTFVYFLQHDHHQLSKWFKVLIFVIFSQIKWSSSVQRFRRKRLSVRTWNLNDHRTNSDYSCTVVISAPEWGGVAYLWLVHFSTRTWGVTSGPEVIKLPCLTKTRMEFQLLIKLKWWKW